MTEQEMREAKVPSLKTPEELQSYIESLVFTVQLVSQRHDYGTCVYAMSMAAVAAFNYVASKLGVTGFQASCADLDVLRRTRNIEGPFMIVASEKMLYPQYDLERDVKKALNDWREWAAGEARKMLADSTDNVHPSVVKHWESLAANMP